MSRKKTGTESAHASLGQATLAKRHHRRLNAVSVRCCAPMTALPKKNLLLMHEDLLLVQRCLLPIYC